MPNIPIPFCGPAYKSDSLAISAQTCVNLYPEINGKDSKSVIALKPTPGSDLWSTGLGGTGEDWTIRTSAADNQWFGVTYGVVSGNGLFVAVASSGTGNRVMTSPDGITWTIRTSAADNNWSDVVYGNGLFVAVAETGTGNRVMTSPDGITWTSRDTTGLDSNWTGVTYGVVSGNGLFVAVARTGIGGINIMTSPDGINWTPRTAPATDWMEVTYGTPGGTGLFVAVRGQVSSNPIMTSPDGINWTLRSVSQDASLNHFHSVVYGNELFVAVADEYITIMPYKIMTSPDGITWTPRLEFSGNWWRSVTFGNGVFVAVAETGTGNRVMTSTTGVSGWTPRTSAADNEWEAVTFGNNRFVAVSSTGTGNRVMTSGPQGVRKIRTCSNNRFFALTGRYLSEMSSDGTVTLRGFINSTTGRIDMSDNGLELIIVDASAGEGWIFTFATNVLAQITSSGYPGGTHVTFINQRFLVNKPDTQQVYWSDLVDGFTWDGSFLSAEGTPDYVTGLISLGGELWVFGDQSYAVYDNIESIFQYIDGTNADIGLYAVSSLAKADKNVFWLAGDDNGFGRVMSNVGYGAQAISDPAMEQAIQRYSTLSDAVGYCYQQLGHEFYVLGFPTAGTTWVFDLSTGMWHERNYTNSDGVKSMHRGVTQDAFNGKVLIGDTSTSNIYQLNPDTVTDYGDTIYRERACPHIWNNLERSFYRSFQLDVQLGVGTAGAGADPQVNMDYSDDGGNTWSTSSAQPAGDSGDYTKRLIWNRLGTSRDRVFRIKMDDPVKWVVLGAYVDIS